MNFSQKERVFVDEEVSRLIDRSIFLVNESYERFKELKSNQMSSHHSLQVIGEGDKLHPSPEGIIRMALHECENNPERRDNGDIAVYITDTLRMLMRSNNYSIVTSDDGKYLMFEIRENTESNSGEH